MDKMWRELFTRAFFAKAPQARVNNLPHFIFPRREYSTHSLSGLGGDERL